MTQDNKNDRYKKITILHSNDLHGDFLAETVDSNLVGGVSMLSGYINKVRKQSPNTLYMIAGDMFRGSLIDSEFQGISTIEIMNALAPDVVSLGNHEVDYGIAHLLFLERCCKFPIVNANVYIKTLNTRLFNSHQIIEMDGMKILVIGILTEEIMARAPKDQLLGTFIDVADAVEEIGVICNSYQNIDIDFTILLTHIGYENDIKLAENLKPEWGVDIIIGGHSHTVLEKPANVNDILIVQAGIGTDQIGHFEIEVDTDTNSIHDYTWKLVPITEEHCDRNKAIEELILNYKKITDEKYGMILTTLTDKATHPNRYRETTVGNLFCDVLRDNFDLDLVMLGSGSLRKEELGPIVTKGNLLDMYSYDEKLWNVQMTGEELKSAIQFMFQQYTGEEGCHSEYYQLSQSFCFTYDRDEQRLIYATKNGRDIQDEEMFSVGMEEYHMMNMQTFLGLDLETVQSRFEAKMLTENIRVTIEEYLKGHTHLVPSLEERTKQIRSK